jgi:class 3 adenylate cyclase
MPPTTAPAATAITPRPLWLLLFFLLGIILPAWLIEQLLVQFETEQARVLDLADRDRARAVMARLERQLDLPSLVGAALDAFAAHAVTALGKRAVTPTRARVLSAAFFKRFPAASRLYWFDRAGRLVQPAGGPPVPERTAWQAVYRTLAPGGGATPAEARLAAHQIRFTMGTLASIESLRRGFEQPVPVLFKGEAMLMAGRVLRPPRARRTGRRPATRLGGFLLLVPTGRASFGWELKRAVARLTTADTKVGGYWQSRQNGYGDGVAQPDGLLNPGLMHGLFQRLENGQGFLSHGGFTFLARFWSQDPDLVLVAAVRQTSPAARQAARAVRLIRGLTIGLVTLAALALLAMGGGLLAPSLRLATRFRLGTMALTGFPLLFLSIWGLDFLVKSAQHREAEVQQELENLLLSAEQAVASGIPHVQNLLRAVTASAAYRRIRDLQDVLDLLRPLQPFGCKDATYARQRWRILSTLTARSFADVGTRTALHYFIKRLLEAAHFQIADLQKTSVPAIESLLSGRDMIDFLPNARLRLIQFGGDQFFLYSLVRKTATGEPRDFLLVTFDFPRFCAWFFQDWLARQPHPERIFLRTLAPAGIRREPRHPRLKELLDLVQFNQELITMRLTIQGRSYLARGRPLAGLSTIGAVIVPDDGGDGIFAHSWRLLALFGVMTLGVAMFLAGILESLLLAPVLTLAGAMDQLERGHYDVVAIPQADDELGALAKGFNQLVEGLRQKARMLPLLNRELVAQAQEAPQVMTERRQVAVSFSGLREFARLEAALPAEEAMAVRSGFLARCEAATRAWGGEIDKFLGDATMAVFFPVPGLAAPEERAVRAALTLQASLHTWMEERTQAGQPIFRHGTGIAAGPVIAGHIGSLRKRLDFTVIGDTVNLAARLEKEAGRPGRPSILATAAVLIRPLPGVRLQPTSITTVRGRVGALTIFGVEASDA